MFKRVGSEVNKNSRLRLSFVSILLCAVALLLCSPALQAQIYYGTIAGTVTDSSGAVVAGATVTVKSGATGAVYTAVSSDSGVYTLAQLPIGVYEVRIAQKGFKEYVASKVEVHTSSDTRIDAQLQLGAASEVVQVEAAAVQVESATAAVGNVIEGTQVRELPLNGENFMGLVTLTPGVAPANSFNSRDKGLLGGADFSVNGNPYNYNLFLVDGVNNNDVGSGRTILVYPSVDTIAEFKMITNSYGPEYGQATGSIISITTKSGTNQYHGGVFYSGRNDKLDANDWFSNFNGTGKAELRRNDWGYNLSGPIIKNKLWAWWNQEWNREVRGISESACVPTAAERSGDFSADASANSAATAAKASNPGSFINCSATLPNLPPALQAASSKYTMNAVDPTAQLFAAFYPQATKAFGAGGNCLTTGDPCTTAGAGQGQVPNWAASENNRPKWSEWNVRADYDVTSKNRVTFRYTNDTWKLPGPAENFGWGDSPFPAIDSDWSQPSKSVMAKLTTQVGNTMVNDFEFGYGHNAIITTLGGTGGTVPNTACSSGCNGLQLVTAIDAAVKTAWPTSLKSAPALPYFGWGGLAPYGSSQEMWTIAPYANHEDLYALQDNVSKVQGNHVWKFGAYYSTNAKIENGAGGGDQPSFNPSDSGVSTKTGNTLSNTLLPGQNFTVGELSTNAVAQVIWHDFEWYAGDTWKIRRNVTLNYGFRWSYFREPYSQVDAWSSWSLSNYNAALPTSDACNGLIVVPGTDPCGNAVKQLTALGISLPLTSGTPGPNRALVNNNDHTIAPRLGVAWDPKGDGKNAFRVGVGQFFQREPVGLDEGHTFNAPFAINATDVRTLETPQALTSPSVSPGYAKDARAVVPNSWQYNISAQRELMRNMTLQVGYVGNVGIHLTSGIQANPIPNTAPCNAAEVAWSCWVQSAFVGTAQQNLLRPAANFGYIQEFQRNGHAHYDSLQVLYKWQLGNFSTIQAAYTWSHSIANVFLDDSSGSVSAQQTTDLYNYGLDKGNSQINRPNIFVLNEVYYLPKLANKAAYVRQTLGGWELNSIITVSSGSSLDVFSSGASAYTPSAGAGTDPCSNADITNGTCVVGAGIGNLNSLLGTGYNSNNRPNRNTSVGCNSGESGRQILNVNSMTIVGITIGDTPGTMGRGVCAGPNYRNVDMALAKNWYFKEHYRVKFGLDFFNMFNHANFYSIEGTNFGTNAICGSIVAGNGTTANPDHYLPCSPTNNVITKIGGAPNSGFGLAGSVHPGREIQYSLRVYF